MTSATREEWRPVPGYEDKYEVSNLGRVRSLFRKKPHVLSPRPANQRHAYLQVALHDDGDGGKSVYIHNVVLEAFVGPRPTEHDPDHRDFDGHNNRLDNLRWLPSPLNRKRRRGTRYENL